ncbi:hypothetical protein RIF29_40553 [Crotalaria pallida]|uniref:F-box domain-containing protein n=1 Tax=Crotalaria pallida TaxID=3830 RepID=A0AAN9E3E1_CROPI
MASSVVEEILLEEILLRLPVKSLTRFKCVSKRWLFQISDPWFCRSHTLRHFTPFPTALLQVHVSAGNSNFLMLPPSSSSSNDNDEVPFAPFITDFQFLNPNSIKSIFVCIPPTLDVGLTSEQVFMKLLVMKEFTAMVLYIGTVHMIIVGGYFEARIQSLVCCKRVSKYVKLCKRISIIIRKQIAALPRHAGRGSIFGTAASWVS